MAAAFLSNGRDVVKFNKLTLVGDTGRRNSSGNKLLLWSCECGGSKEAPIGSVKAGNIKTCGAPVHLQERIAKSTESLKKKWASGTRKANPQSAYEKVSIAVRKAYAEGRGNRPTREQAMAANAALSPERKAELARKLAESNIGKPGKGRAAKSPEHHKALHWELIAPNEEKVEGFNLNHIVRENPHLFDPKDLNWNGGHICRATRGIRRLFELKPDGELKNHSWKGWRIGDKMKREFLEKIRAEQQTSTIE